MEYIRYCYVFTDVGRQQGNILAAINERVIDKF